MLNKEVEHIIGRSSEQGWILEPDAKHLLKLSAIEVPKFICTQSMDDAFDFAHKEI